MARALPCAARNGERADRLSNQCRLQPSTPRRERPAPLAPSYVQREQRISPRPARHSPPRVADACARARPPGCFSQCYCTQPICHVLDAGRIPNIIVENKFVTVGMSDKLRALFYDCIRNESGAKDGILLSEQNAG